MKTKISLMLLGLGLVSASVYAGAVAEPLPVSNDINVTAPDQSGMWSFGATAVLMQPTNHAFSYADTSTQTISGLNNTSDAGHPSVNEGYHWWFGADVAYAFVGNGRDVTLAYEGLHGNDSDHTNADSLGTNVPLAPPFPLTSSFTGLPYLDAEGETQTNYDAGDLVLGQKLDVGTRVRLHPFMGLRYAHIDVDNTGKYANTTVFGATTNAFENSEIDNTFNGIGPRLGSDGQINLGQGFSLRGRLGISALIGTHKVDAHGSIPVYDNNNTLLVIFGGSDSHDSETLVVPEIDGRLGLNYTYNFDSGMALGVEAGWQATNYFNVVSDQYRAANFGSDNSGGEHFEDTSNFGVQGPYARIQLDIA